MNSPAAFENDPDRGAPIGYLPHWSYRPSDSLDVHVSCTLPWTADIVRLHHGDPRPDGPGLRETPITTATGPQEPVVPRTYPGSMAWAPVRGLPESMAIVAWIRPTRPSAGTTQTVLSGQRHDGTVAWAIEITANGRWAVRTDSATAVSANPVAVSAWHLAQLVIDHAPGSVHLTTRSLDDRHPAISMTAQGVSYHELTCIGIGGGLPHNGAISALDHHTTFDGVIAEPSLVNHALSDQELDRIRQGSPITSVAGGAVLAGWVFPPGRPPVALGAAATESVVLRNAPAAAMPGPHRTNDALHCHSDDLTDAEWPVGVQLPVPGDAPSGVYAVRLHSAAGCDRIPFVVRPTAATRVRVLLLLPTMTYLAYANEQLPAPGNYLEDYVDVAKPHQIDRWLARHPEYGYSVYDCHADGSGVNYSSLRRPIPNIRPDYLHWATNEPRHLGADLFIVDWLNRTGVPYDVACDHDLDGEGFALLDHYRLVVTGSHPEYSTANMLDALEHHLDCNGNLMYLGGNGFYWVTSTSTAEPATLEVRRGPHGYPWRCPGYEAMHAFDGQRGGFWADHGRSPQDLVGVAFAAMGPEERAPGYTISDTLPEREGWIIEGLEPGTPLGTRGRLMGGAAGHEIDCVDPRHGPDGVAIIASSEGHADSLQIAPDRLANLEEADLLKPHADLVLYRRPSGGTVMSTGSICWCGSLAEPGGDRNAQRLTENALRMLSDSSHSASMAIPADVAST